MTAPRKAPQTGPMTSERPAPHPVRAGGQPTDGKHVASNVPGHVVHDNSRNVGSNITPAPGPDRESGQVLSAPPWAAAYPTPGMEQAPMY